MALAPKGDPRRPLQLAIRSTRLLGIMFSFIGLLVFAIPVLAPGARSLATVVAIAVGVIYLIPGILYFVFHVFLARREKWAVIATMVVAGVHGLIGLVALAGAAMQGNVILAFICLLWVAALAQLIVHLSKSFESIRVAQEYAPRGFEPLMPTPVQMPPSSPPGDTL